jgi:hypothetical protein
MAIRLLGLGLGGALIGARGGASDAQAADGTAVIVGAVNITSVNRTLLTNRDPNSPAVFPQVSPMVRVLNGVLESDISGDNFQDGLQGHTAIANAAGLYGRGLGIGSVGVWGVSTNGTGVFAQAAAGNALAATASSGTGVFGQTNGSGGYGVRGNNTDGGNISAGILGTSQDGNGNGFGVRGISRNGPAGRFETSGSGTAVVALASAEAGIGVQGFVTNGNSNSIGVQGFSKSGFGLFGETNDGAGFVGRANTDGAGVAGSFTSNASYAQSGPPTVAVSNLKATDADLALGLICNGDLWITNGRLVVAKGAGFKNAAVRTSRGQTLMYSVEASVSVFEDFGRARLVNGQARVELDPLFMETIEPDYDVYLTARGMCQGLCVTSMDSSGFTVREAGGGNASVDFGYRVVGQGKGLSANHRMARIDTDGVRLPRGVHDIPPAEKVIASKHIPVGSHLPESVSTPSPRGGGSDRSASNGNPASSPSPRQR